jgi:hypothetical protein
MKNSHIRNFRILLIVAILLISELSCKESPQALHETTNPGVPTDTTEVPTDTNVTNIWMDPVLVLSDTKIYIWGWSDFSGVVGEANIEYGHSTTYGKTTPSLGIGPAGYGVPIDFIIDGLTPGTMYHWRAKITCSIGLKRTPDTIFTLPATVTPFDFPLHIGDTWRYRYHTRMYSFSEGVHTWRIVNTDGNGNWACMDTRVDSISPYTPRYVDSTSFIIRSFPDYFQIDFPEWIGIMSENAKRIPRLFDTAKDTLSFSRVHRQGISGYEKATYVRGIGLVSYGVQEPHMMGHDAYLDLIEHISP